MPNLAPQPETVGESPTYWNHKVGKYPGPVSVTRMAQLIDFDDRLYETARIVYRFLISWYHDEHGDALMSMNHVSKTMKQRAPSSAVVPSRSAVHRAIIALMETGWVVRTFKGRGKGKGASRYVPVMNVLDLAAQGKFPQPSHANGIVEPSHSTGTLLSHATGTVELEPSHSTGIKTLSHDPRTDADTCREELDFAPPASALSGDAAAKGGFDELFKAYGVRKEFAAGKVEYEKLAPSPELHDEMVEAAKSWRSSAGDIERMHLARWLREERFREDPMIRKAKPAPEASNDNEPAVPAEDALPDWMKGSPRLWPVGEYWGEFIENDAVKEGASDLAVQLTFRISTPGPHFGKELRHHFYHVCFMASAQKEGRDYMAAICSAVGEEAVEDLDNLMFKPLKVSADGHKLRYSKLEAEAA